jgi:3-oxoacyl-[acyl-carrier-protein] synthase II
MRIGIQGIGLTGGFGSSVDSLHAALCSGTVVTQQGRVEHNGLIDTFPAYQASLDGLDEFIPKRALRRIDHCSRMTLFAAHLALKDAGMAEADRSRLGVIIASGYGPLKTTFDFLDSYLDFGYACSSPTHFSNSVHNAAAAHVSMQLKTTAPSLTVTQFEMSVPSALLTARQWLTEGRVDQVLFGAVDEQCDVLRYCRQQFFGDGEQGPLQPFAFDTQSAVVGEGAVFFLLTRDETAIYGHIDEVKLGNHAVSPIKISQDESLIIGADGHKECGQWYAQVAKKHATSAYTPLYGSFPAAAGFDLAVAALSMRENRLFVSPELTGAMPLTPTEPHPLDDAKLASLKFGKSGEYGLIRMSR